jgi:hypothetical protein
MPYIKKADRVPDPILVSLPLHPEPGIVDPAFNEARLSKIENTLDKMTDVLSALAENMPAKKEAPAKPMNPTQVEKIKEEVQALEVPPSWRAIVDKYLGPDFQTVLQESAGGNFSMLIIFPEDIDRRIGTSREPGTRDRSMFSPIRLANTQDDIKRWCELTVQNIKQTPKYNEFKPKIV